MHEQLENQIAQWRQGLADRLGDDAGVLDELESHLREEVDRLVQAGQTPEQALAAALAKVGAPDALAPEFAKLAAPWWPVHFVVIGLGLVVFCFAGFFGYLLPRSDDTLLGVHVVGVTLGYVTTYAIGMLMLSYACRRPLRELSAGQQASLLRALGLIGWTAFGLTLLGVVLGGFWANEHLGRFWAWDVKETGGLIVLSWQAILLLSLRRPTPSLRWLMCWGLLGNGAVTYAWFVAAILSRVHDHDPWINTLIPWLLGLTVLHLAAMASALLPSGWARRWIKAT